MVRPARPPAATGDRPAPAPAPAPARTPPPAPTPRGDVSRRLRADSALGAPVAQHSARLTTVYYGICAVAVTLLAARPVPRPDPVPLAVGLALLAAIVPVRVLVMRGPRYAVLDPVAYGVFFLGFVVLRHATGETLAAVQRDRPSFRLQVNLSGLSVGAGAVVAAIVESLERTGADGRGLVLEITETVAIPDFDAARTFMAALRAHSVRFALDDFGAGYGSLAYVKHLRFDYLKIDGDFVQHCADDPADRLLIDAVVAMARASDCQTIAEFVTDEATLETITAHGVDHAQGYHVGRPVPLADLLAHLGSAPPEPAAASPGPAGGPEAAYSAV